MLPFVPALLGSLKTVSAIGGIAATAMEVAQAAKGAAGASGARQAADSFTDVLQSADIHGNGWISRAAALGEDVIAGGRLLAPEDITTTTLPPAPGSTAAEAALADSAQGNAPGSTGALWPERPTVEAIRASYDALRAAR